MDWMNGLLYIRCAYDYISVINMCDPLIAQILFISCDYIVISIGNMLVSVIIVPVLIPSKLV